jgi:hypothetical protein
MVSLNSLFLMTASAAVAFTRAAVIASGHSIPTARDTVSIYLCIRTKAAHLLPVQPSLGYVLCRWFLRPSSLLPGRRLQSWKLGPVLASVDDSMSALYGSRRFTLRAFLLTYFTEF